MSQQRVHVPDASLPSAGFPRAEFPGFFGTIKALRLPAVPLAALRFLRADDTTGSRIGSLPRRLRAAAVGPGVGHPVAPAGISSVETTGSPKFLGNPDARLPMFSDPGRPMRP